MSDAKIPVILLDDGPPPEFLVDESRLQAACALADGGVVHAAIASSGAVSSDTSFNAMLAHAVPVASGSYRLNLVGKALYRAVRAVANGVVLRDIYFLAEHLRAMNGRERSALRVALSQERREATRLEGVVEFAASLSAVEWDGSLGPKAYAGWLRRCGDLPARLRSRAQGVEATFALRGGLSHALRVLKAGGGRREALARLGGSVAGGVYALFL